ncbi:MAG: hypothetical protein ACR2HF_04460, partial [Methylococcaceae bacterium]
TLTLLSIDHDGLMDADTFPITVNTTAPRNTKLADNHGVFYTHNSEGTVHSEIIGILSLSKDLEL